MKKRILKIIPYVVVFFLGVYLTEIINCMILGLAQYKVNIGTHWKEVLLNGLMHPLANTHLYLTQHNPLMWVGIIFMLGFVFYKVIQNRNKAKAWKTSGEQTHGSATWGTLSEITRENNSYKVMSEKRVNQDFNKSIDMNVINKLKELRSKEQ